MHYSLRAISFLFSTDKASTPMRDPISTVPPAPDAPVFTAVLRPHRSLSDKGLTYVMGFVGIVGLAVSIPFFLLGAWPVVGFMGLDVALIYLAFRANNRAARACEEILLTRFNLVVRAISPKGRTNERRFNPHWTRLEREEHPDFGTERLDLVQGRARLEIARFLGREQRGEFANAFQRALQEAKR